VLLNIYNFRFGIELFYFHSESLQYPCRTLPLFRQDRLGRPLSVPCTASVIKIVTQNGGVRYGHGWRINSEPLPLYKGTNISYEKQI
jgi:hypothetical protein